MRNMTVLSAQDLCITAWSMAALELRDWTLLDAIASEVLPKLKACGAQGIANLIWSCATLLWFH